MITNSKTERHLIYDFVNYLWKKMIITENSRTKIELLMIYNQILGYSHTRQTDYLADVDHLLEYKEINGCYPANFQLLFNQWLLERG